MMGDLTIRVLPDGIQQTIPFGMRIQSLFTRVLPDQPIFESSYDQDPIVAALVNNELRSLSTPLEYETDILPVRLTTEHGKRMFRHTLCFLAVMAASRVFSERRLIIGHSLGDGYYFTFADTDQVSEREISLLTSAMQEIVEARILIETVFLSYQQTISLCRSRRFEDTELLMRYHNAARFPVYRCAEYMDISYEPMLPHTGLLDRFELRAYGGEGFLLRYPRQEDLSRIGEFLDNPVLFSVYKEYKEWGSIIGVNSLGKLNRLCEQRDAEHFIQVAEAFQNKKISQIADTIASDRDKIKFVFIAGPSSSGKTTFTKKLGIQLRVNGFEPIEISLDDYYRPRHEVPLDEFGEPDLEALESLERDQIEEDLTLLMQGEEIETRKFDFVAARRIPTGRRIRLTDRSIIILEGIHGLNPALAPSIPKQIRFNIYISALTQLNLDDHNRIATTDNRIIRRIVRDHRSRGMTAKGTLEMWPSVHRGEKRNIFPYQNQADVAFNSALDYELAVLKPFAEPLLKTVKPSDGVYTEAVRLLAFLENFYPIPPHLVPDRSILREFIGNSGFIY